MVPGKKLENPEREITVCDNSIKHTTWQLIIINKPLCILYS